MLKFVINVKEANFYDTQNDKQLCQKPQTFLLLSNYLD